MITETIFKGVNALKLENDQLEVIVIPGLGGKIASVLKKDKNFEFYFQHKKDMFLMPELYSGFAEFDASGFDDCFPSVDSSSVNVNGTDVEYPDHGEIWSGRMDYEITDDKVILSYSSVILPYTYRKDISLIEDRITLDYKIHNTGSESFPCIWTMHGLLNCEDGMEILLPAGTASVVNVQDNQTFGKPGEVYSWPDAVLEDGNVYHLNKIGLKKTPATAKFYVNGDIASGECGVYYSLKDVSCIISFNKDQFPYLGLWITEGGFRGDYNLALEPSDGFYDSIYIAEKNHKIKMLNPGEKNEFSFLLRFSDGKCIQS